MAKCLARAEFICGSIVALAVGLMAWQTYPSGSMFFVLFTTLLAFLLVSAGIATLRGSELEGRNHEQ